MTLKIGIDVGGHLHRLRGRARRRAATHPQDPVHAGGPVDRGGRGTGTDRRVATSAAVAGRVHNRYTNVKPLVPRSRRAGIAGRIDRDGRETEPLDSAGVQQALAAWRAEGVQAVAVCFMNSYANPAHEQAAAEMVRHALPDAYLSVSTDVLPSICFYERVSTTALNAYVGPKLEHYLAQLVDRLTGAGFSGLLLIMQSNGGVISPQAARDKATLTLLSGRACSTSPRTARTAASPPTWVAPVSRPRLPSARHRCRRRLDRLARPGRTVAHGPVKRRRPSRPGLLRARRPAADDH